jgi:hypothetical protein
MRDSRKRSFSRCIDTANELYGESISLLEHTSWVRTHADHYHASLQLVEVAPVLLVLRTAASSRVSLMFSVSREPVRVSHQPNCLFRLLMRLILTFTSPSSP